MDTHKTKKRKRKGNRGRPAAVTSPTKPKPRTSATGTIQSVTSYGDGELEMGIIVTKVVRPCREMQC